MEDDVVVLVEEEEEEEEVVKPGKAANAPPAPPPPRVPDVRVSPAPALLPATLLVPGVDPTRPGLSAPLLS